MNTVNTDLNHLPLTRWSATDLAAGIRAGDVSAVEVMTAHLDRIEECNEEINVIVSQVSRADALAMAKAADGARVRGDELGPLHGLPTAVKDLVDVEGLPTSRGSRAFAGLAAVDADAPLVRKLKQAGALVIGKTNTPEYGVGTLTFNDVFGVTRNPYAVDRHAGGSSGGAAAVAAGMLPFVDGSDSGGSLRYPASFCNVVGLRTTAGTIATDAAGAAWEPHSVQGPMARTSRDAALVLSAMSGPASESPVAWGRPSTQPLPPVGAGSDRPLRLGWSDDLDGLPISPEVRRVMSEARVVLQRQGVEIVDVDLPLADADEAWQIIEMFGFFMLGGQDVFDHPEKYSADFVRNCTEGAALTPTDLGRAMSMRYDIFRRSADALRGLDGVVSPATPVAAPPVEDRWVAEIDGIALERYFLWQRLACRMTMTSHPVLVTGAGFTPEGLPVGMQIMGHCGQDFDLLAVGDLIESSTPWNRMRPGDDRK